MSLLGGFEEIVVSWGKVQLMGQESMLESGGEIQRVKEALTRCVLGLSMKIGRKWVTLEESCVTRATGEAGSCVEVRKELLLECSRTELGPDKTRG